MVASAAWPHGGAPLGGRVAAVVLRGLPAEVGDAVRDAARWLGENRHLVLAIVWACLVIPTLLWWKNSILWVLLLSLYANFEASLAAHHAKRKGAS